MAATLGRARNTLLKEALALACVVFDGLCMLHRAEYRRARATRREKGDCGCLAGPLDLDRRLGFDGIVVCGCCKSDWSAAAAVSARQAPPPRAGRLAGALPPSRAAHRCVCGCQRGPARTQGLVRGQKVLNVVSIEGAAAHPCSGTVINPPARAPPPLPL